MLPSTSLFTLAGNLAFIGNTRESDKFSCKLLSRLIIFSYPSRQILLIIHLQEYHQLQRKQIQGHLF